MIMDATEMRTAAYPPARWNPNDNGRMLEIGLEALTCAALQQKPTRLHNKLSGRGGALHAAGVRCKKGHIFEVQTV